MIELKSISEVLDKEFVIPSYQRGYRWGEVQVQKLLDDIWEFTQIKTKNEFYPLQPIVVFNINNRYEIIDGQQRLTTLYIIFKYLRDLFHKIKLKKDELSGLESIFNLCFGKIESLNIDFQTSIKYETREDEKSNSAMFLKHDISKGINFDNPDYYYMSSAYATIKYWFRDKHINLSSFINTLSMDVKVIWYEVEASDEKAKRDIFARLNIGKIELTNAELIKALLLKDITSYKNQIELGNELDKIEYSLQNDNFWYFLNDKDKSTRIDLLYELLAQKYQKDLKLERFDKKYDLKYAFYVFDESISKKLKEKNEIIQEVKYCFRFLEEWYYDKEFYHKIGYLLNVTNKKLLEFIEKYESVNKAQFRTFLDETIKENLKEIIISDLRYGRDSAKIKKVLLLFNIQTILNNKNISYQFDFKAYNAKNRSDDIEHIRSQTDVDIQDKKRESWLLMIEKYFEEIEDKNKKIEDDKEFQNYYEKIKKEFNEDNDFDEDLKDSIGNLTLLDSSINRSYGNAFFPIKRSIILEKDREGIFIPQCTKDVFLKVYSNSIKNMMSWGEEDIKNHQKKITEILKDYLELENAE